MKNSILTLAAIVTLFTSCTKEADLQPVTTPTDYCGIVTEIIDSIPFADTLDYSVKYKATLVITTDTDIVTVERTLDAGALDIILGYHLCASKQELN